MKKKVIYIAVLATAFILVSYQQIMTNSSTPPTAKTGAPGDGNCTSCHSGTVNSGSGTSSITFGNSDTTYIPGQVYTVTVSITQTSITKFGFELLALDASNANAGTITVTNTTNTASTTSGSKVYIHHKNAGSSNSWSFSWTAPSSNVGAITFYAALNATNADGGSAGDNIYTISKTINPDVSSFVGENFATSLGTIRPFPNPATTDFVNINYSLQNEGTVVLRLTDLTGKEVQTVNVQNKIPGNYSETLNLSGLSSGIYILNLNSKDHHSSQKILIQ